jgi:hypothetical protein
MTGKVLLCFGGNLLYVLPFLDKTTWLAFGFVFKVLYVEEFTANSKIELVHSSSGSNCKGSNCLLLTYLLTPRSTVLEKFAASQEIPRIL